MSEIQKHADAQPSMAAILDFLEWCGTQKVELAKWTESGRRLLPVVENPEELLTRYFEIDPVKLENERRALLARCGSKYVLSRAAEQKK